LLNAPNKSQVSASRKHPVILLGTKERGHQKRKSKEAVNLPGEKKPGLDIGAKKSRRVLSTGML